MADPQIHAENSAKRFGGKSEDYIDIHELLDSSGIAFPDLRHRALTHNSWFIKTILPKVFGRLRKNSDGNEIAVVLIGQWHVLEDYGGRFVPSAQDFIEQITFKDWMDTGKGGNVPPSHAKMLKLEDEPFIVLPPQNDGPVRGCRNGPPGAFD